MKNFPAYAPLLLVAAAHAVGALVPLSRPQRPPQLLPRAFHTFRFHTGEEKSGWVCSTEKGRIRILIELLPDTFAEVSFARESIASVVPTEWPNEPSNQKMESLHKEWQILQGLLGISGARVGELGNALAAQKGAIEDFPEALRLYVLVENASANARERWQARAGKLRLQLKKAWRARNDRGISEATQEAQTWQEEATASKASSEEFLEVAEILSEGLLALWKVFLEENPRWKDDPWALAEGKRLKNRCLNAALQPWVLHPWNSKQGMAGLDRAEEVYRLSGEAPPEPLSADHARERGGFLEAVSPQPQRAHHF